MTLYDTFRGLLLSQYAVAVLTLVLGLSAAWYFVTVMTDKAIDDAHRRAYERYRADRDAQERALWDAYGWTDEA
ncbi:MAG: hypothetical protein JWP11_3810 [Frankiales bacterium]|nr:hypothetical protein [Frankiales bacterium]